MGNLNNKCIQSCGMEPCPMFLYGPDDMSTENGRSVWNYTRVVSLNS